MSSIEPRDSLNIHAQQYKEYKFASETNEKYSKNLTWKTNGNQINIEKALKSDSNNFCNQRHIVIFIFENTFIHAKLAFNTFKYHVSHTDGNISVSNTFKYHVFAPMGRFQLESIYLYFPPSSQLLYLCFCPVGLSLL